MGPAIPASQRGGSGGQSSEHHVENDTSAPVSWQVRHNTALTVAAACVAPIFYLLYVNHYAVNSFYFDDSSTFVAMNAALHGHLPLGQLWLQYTEGRQFLSNSVFVLFALFDRANVRSILFFSAAAFIASYIVVLALFRQYLRTRLTPLPVLTIGLVWFSLADVGNSLFAYQLSCYLMVLSAVVMLFALVVPSSHRTLWFAVAVLAAIAASVSFLNGFIAWPLGVICILWCQPRTRRSVCEISVWIISMLVTATVYFSGYQASGCAPIPGAAIPNCTVGNAVAHPLKLVQVFLALIGGVFPGGYLSGRVHSVARFEVVGAVLLAGAVFVIIQSWRYRSSRERVPLPMLMVCFSLLWDAMITLGRAGYGVTFIVGVNRYVMPNLILLTAIVMYAWTHIPPLRLPSAGNVRLTYLPWLTLFFLALFVVIQVSDSTSFGLSNGRDAYDLFTTDARLWVNLDRVPAQDRSCEINLVLDTNLFTGGPPWEPAKDHLGEFGPSSYHHYRELGPPPLSPKCTRVPSRGSSRQ
jgi:hypothetical protein